jgi:hypothetical protein
MSLTPPFGVEAQQIAVRVRDDEVPVDDSA